MVEKSQAFTLSLPPYDSAIMQLFKEIQLGLYKTDPILGQIQTVPVAHGGTTRQVSEPNLVDTSMKLFSTDMTLEIGWFIRTDVMEFTNCLWFFTSELNSQAKQHLFETISLTSEAVGNVFDAKGKNTWDAQIEMLENMEIHFDEEGNHNLTLCVHPDTARKLAENPPTPEQQKRWEDALRARKEEYYAQKRTRRLS